MTYIGELISIGVAGIIGFTLLLYMREGTAPLREALHDRKGLSAAIATTVFGPFVGVGFSLMAVQYTGAGTASTLMAMTPIIILLPSYWLFHEKSDGCEEGFYQEDEARKQESEAFRTDDDYGIRRGFHREGEDDGRHTPHIHRPLTTYFLGAKIRTLFEISKHFSFFLCCFKNISYLCSKECVYEDFAGLYRCDKETFSRVA